MEVNDGRRVIGLHLFQDAIAGRLDILFARDSRSILSVALSIAVNVGPDSGLNHVVLLHISDSKTSS